MAQLVWDQVGDHLYETGISKGVLYKDDGVGVPWNGLTSIEENVPNSVEAVHFDGVKFNDIVTLGDFTAVMRAFTYPEEFMKYEGTLEDQTGFYVTNQPQSRFGLSYQTLVGNDVEGVTLGYKIHLLYNLTALPSQREYQTLSDSVDPIEFEWDISAIPEEIDYFRPTAHIIFDSRKIDSNLLKDIEDILYGDEENDPVLPPLKALTSYIRRWQRLIITDLGNGLWTAEATVEGIITMLDDTTFQIDTDTAEYLDADTYTITSSEKEDLWLP